MSTISISSEDEDDVINFYSPSVSKSSANYFPRIIEIYKPPRHEDQQNWEEETDPFLDHTMEIGDNGGETLLGSRNDSTTVTEVDLGKILVEDDSRDSEIEEILNVNKASLAEDCSDVAKNFENRNDNNATSKAGSARKISIMQLLAIQLAKAMPSFDSSVKFSTNEGHDNDNTHKTMNSVSQDVNVGVPRKKPEIKKGWQLPEDGTTTAISKSDVSNKNVVDTSQTITESCSITEEIPTEDLHQIKTPRKRGRPKGRRNNPKTERKTEETPEMEIIDTDQNAAEKGETETCPNSISREFHAVGDLLKNEKPKKRGRPKGRRNNPKTERTTEETPEMEIIATDQNPSEKMEMETRLNSIPGEAHAVGDLLKNEKPKKRGRPKVCRKYSKTSVSETVISNSNKNKEINAELKLEQTTMMNSNYHSITGDIRCTNDEEKGTKKVENDSRLEEKTLPSKNNKTPSPEKKKKSWKKRLLQRETLSDFDNLDHSNEANRKRKSKCLDMPTLDSLEDSMGQTVGTEKCTITDVNKQIISIENKKCLFENNALNVHVNIKVSKRPKIKSKHQKKAPTNKSFNQTQSTKTSIKVGTIRIKPNEELFNTDKLHCAKEAVSNSVSDTIDTRIRPVEEQYVDEQNNGPNAESSPLDKRNSLAQVFLEPSNLEKKIIPNNIITTTNFTKCVSICNDDLFWFLHYDRGDSVNERLINKSKEYKPIVKLDFENKSFARRNYVKSYNLAYDDNGEYICNKMGDILHLSLNEFSNLKIRLEKCRKLTCDKLKQLEISSAMKYYRESFLHYKASFQKQFINIYDKIFYDNMIIEHFKECRRVLLFTWLIKLYLRVAFLSSDFDESLEDIRTYIIYGFLSNLHIQYPLLEKVLGKSASKFEVECWAVLGLMRDCYKEEGVDPSFMDVPSKKNSADGMKDKGQAKKIHLSCQTSQKECMANLSGTIHSDTQTLHPKDPKEPFVKDLANNNVNTSIPIEKIKNAKSNPDRNDDDVQQKKIHASGKSFQKEYMANLSGTIHSYTQTLDPKDSKEQFVEDLAKDNENTSIPIEGTKNAKTNPERNYVQSNKILLSGQTSQKECMANLSGTIKSDRHTLESKDPKEQFVEDLAKDNVNTSISIEGTKNAKNNPERNDDHVQSNKILLSGQTSQKECMANLSGKIKSDRHTPDSKDLKEQFLENLSNENGNASFAIESKKAGGENKKISLHNYSPSIVDKGNDNTFPKMEPQPPRATVICNPVNKTGIPTTDQPVNELVVRQHIDNNCKEMCIWNPIRSHLQSDCSLSTRQVQHQNNSLRECMPHRVILSSYHDKGDAERNFSSRLVQSTNLDKDSGRATAAKPTNYYDPRCRVNYTKHRGRVVNSHTRHGTNHRDDYRPRPQQTYPTATPHYGPNRYLEHPGNAAQALPRTSDHHLQEPYYSNIHTGYKNYYQNHYTGPYQISSLHSPRTTNPMPNSAGVTPSVRYAGLTRGQIYMRHHLQTLYGSDLYRQYMMSQYNSQNGSTETNYRGTSHSSQSYALDYSRVNNSSEFPNPGVPAASVNGTSSAAPWRLSDGSYFNP